MESSNPYLSRKFILTVICMLMGFVAMMTGKTDWVQFSLFVGPVTLGYFAGNAWEAGKWPAAPGSTTTSATQSTITSTTTDQPKP